MKNKLIFIGPILQGQLAQGGDTMKNQLFLQRFSQVYDEVIAIDTFGWEKRPGVFVQLVWTLLVHRKTPVVISANPGSADTLLRFIHAIGLDKNVVYWVVGGSFHEMMEEGRFGINQYRKLKAILVQGQSMVESLHKSGLTNARYVPNSKIINRLATKNPKTDNITHFVFLSRVEESKGCKLIFESIDALNEHGYKGHFDVVFYGKMSEDKEFATYFNKAIDEHEETSYEGLLNLRDEKNYDVLARYDVMLFPTFWHGEGFPGIVIDAYIASLPIIATDWNLNKDVIKEGETGWIIPVHDINALADKMAFAIDNPEVVKQFSENSSALAMEYDSRNVLSVDNLKRIGLL